MREREEQMEHQCKHGKLIQVSWQECSECWAEWENRVTAQVAPKGASQQTQLLEDFAVKRATDTITCPNPECGNQLAWDISRAGREASCPYCGQLVAFRPRPEAVENCQQVMQAYASWLK